MYEKVVLRTEFQASIEDTFDGLSNVESVEESTESVRIATRGDGDGMRCYFNFKKEFLDIPAQYTARIRITDYDRPNTIEWEMARDLELSGSVEFSESGENTVVTATFKLDPDRSNLNSLPAPKGTSVKEIVDFLLPKFRSEIDSIFQDLAANIEGTKRRPDVTVIESTVDSVPETL